MRKIFIFLTLFAATLCSFASVADTTAIDQSSITRWIVDSTKTSKGKLSVKYYCIYKGQLVLTNKTTMKSVAICKKYGAKCALILITSTSGRKRIVCN